MEDKELARQKREKLRPHPKTKANCLSHFLFCWEIPIIFRGWKKELTEDDLYKPLSEYDSKKLTDKLEELWYQEEYFSKKPSLWRSIARLFGFEYLKYGLFYIIPELTVAMLQPFCLKKLLDFYTPGQKQVNLSQAYGFAGGLAALSFLRILSFHYFIFESTVIGMKVRIACSSLIYRRALAMKKCAMADFTMGKIINLLSNDLTRFDQLSTNMHYIWIGIVEFMIVTYYVDANLGHAAIAGGAIILACMAFQVFLLRQMSTRRMKVADKTDYRIRLMNDIICGIEAIKMYTWEKPFALLVEISRRLEIKQIKSASQFRLFNNAFKIYMSKFCVFLSVVVFVVTGNTLTSQYAFVLVSIYETFKFSIIVFLPLGVVMLAETIISVQRIEGFLLNGSNRSEGLIKNPKVISTQLDSCVLKSQKEYVKRTVGISLTNVCVKWDPKWTKYVLEDVSFKAMPGELVGIMGRAGSGKSTLLHVILREIDSLRGNCEIEGSISYASQEPWIFQTSIRQNIIFGEEFVLEKYLRVVKVCALERDLTLFPYGDQTLVGERGVMLSGGQKARINLARAVYRESDIYLLDDPLSAVDAHVARHIFDECINGYLRDKCVVLVTHQIHYLQKADRIYQIEMGEVSKVGTYEEVIGLVDHTSDAIPSEPTTTTVATNNDVREEVKEHRSAGGTTKKIYKDYSLAAGHGCFTVLVVLLFALGQLCISVLDSFLTFWANVEQKAINLTSEMHEVFTTEHCLYIYIGITVVSIFVIHVATVVFTVFCMRSSKRLHDNMLFKIVYGPMTFFNNHSSGRLLNRFSKDIGTIDELLPLHLMNGITVICTAIAIIIIIVCLNYWMIIPSVCLLTVTIVFSVLFQPINRNVKRTEGSTKSSVFTHMSATIQGLATIRAHKSEQQLIQEFDDFQDLHSSAYYLFTATFASFGFWADFSAALYTAFVVFSFFLLGSGNRVANVGFAITQSINLLGMVQYGVKTFGELDSHMTSVERVVEYAELEPEADEGKSIPPDTWPSAGNVTFQAVTLRYNPDDPPVLKQASFQVHAGEKVGIIGRTGAGKTTLISALFRLFQFEGSVVIDNVDTTTIPLNSMRSKISIIPQEPVLFLGSLRKNIDPFDEFSDGQIWCALEELELKPMISSLPSGLESLVTERGSNFSVGQRQLLCLVRAILRNNKVIVLDEATANVDLRTDELIQSVIRKKFRDCTVLTIAHRLNTIIDSDKILAMDGGRVVEFEHPYLLLKNASGYFYSFVAKNGDKMMKDFIRIAKNSYDNRANRYVTQTLKAM